VILANQLESRSGTAATALAIAPQFNKMSDTLQLVVTENCFSSKEFQFHATAHRKRELGDTTCFSSVEFQFRASAHRKRELGDTTCFSRVEFQFIATAYRKRELGDTTCF